MAFGEGSLSRRCCAGRRGQEQRQPGQAQGAGERAARHPAGGERGGEIGACPRSRRRVAALDGARAAGPTVVEEGKAAAQVVQEWAPPARCAAERPAAYPRQRPPPAPVGPGRRPWFTGVSRGSPGTPRTTTQEAPP